MVIFGAGGDLTRSKLIPALYNLAESRLLSDDFAVVAFARELEEAAFRDQLRRGIREHLTGEFQQRIWDWLDKRLYRVLGDFRDPEAYGRLKDLLDKVDGEHGTAGNYLYYMATRRLPRRRHCAEDRRKAQGPDLHRGFSREGSHEAAARGDSGASDHEGGDRARWSCALRCGARRSVNPGRVARGMQQPRSYPIRRRRSE